MYARMLRKAEHTRRFTVVETYPAGWEVREEQDSEVISRQRYTDWHRVERAQIRIAHAVGVLVDDGWEEAR